MDPIKESLMNQQRINEAVKPIIDYFMSVGYEDELELMFSAQTQIMGLMELAKQQMVNTNGKDELKFQTSELTIFMQTVRDYLHMLKPFAMMVD